MTKPLLLLGAGDHARMTVAESLERRLINIPSRASLGEGAADA